MTKQSKSTQQTAPVSLSKAKKALSKKAKKVQTLKALPTLGGFDMKWHHGYSKGSQAAHSLMAVVRAGITKSELVEEREAEGVEAGDEDEGGEE